MSLSLLSWRLDNRHFIVTRLSHRVGDRKVLQVALGRAIGSAAGMILGVLATPPKGCSSLLRNGLRLWSFPGPADDCIAGKVEAEDGIERAIRRGKPVRFFRWTGIVVRDVKSERAVGAIFIALKRGGVEEIALERVGYEKLGLAVVHGK